MKTSSMIRFKINPTLDSVYRIDCIFHVRWNNTIVQLVAFFWPLNFNLEISSLMTVCVSVANDNIVITQEEQKT